MAPSDTAHAPDDNVAVATQAEFEAARDRELDALGLTMDDLVAQAASCDFVSERARRAWMAYAPLND